MQRQGIQWWRCRSWTPCLVGLVHQGEDPSRVGKDRAGSHEDTEGIHASMGYDGDEMEVHMDDVEDTCIETPHSMVGFGFRYATS